MIGVSPCAAAAGYAGEFDQARVMRSAIATVMGTTAHAILSCVSRQKRHTYYACGVEREGPAVLLQQRHELLCVALPQPVTGPHPGEAGSPVKVLEPAVAAPGGRPWRYWEHQFDLDKVVSDHS